jgi:hypothetical protein
VKKLGFKPTLSDTCTFTRDDCILTVYVDDVIIATPNAEIGKEVYRQLGEELPLKEFKKLEWCLGISIDQKRKCIDQELYTTTILKRFHMLDSKPARTPENYKTQLSKISKELRGYIDTLMEQKTLLY